MDEKNKAIIGAITGITLQLILGGLTLIISGWSGSAAAQAIGLFSLLSSLIWGLTFLHTRQEYLAEEEIKDLAETEKQGALFESQDLGALSARAGLRRLEKYLIPAATLLLAIGFIATAAYLYTSWNKEGLTAPVIFLMPGALVFGLGSIFLFYGMYIKGMTSVPGWRVLRSGSSAMLFTSFAFMAVGVSILLCSLGLPGIEKYLAWIIVLIFVLTGTELIFNMVTSFFVPRLPGTVILPPYYLRSLDVITSPRDILKTAADIVDYQFGFRVSDTWFYTFLERAIMPIIIFWILILYAFTCIVIIGPDEQGIIEHFGNPNEQILSSGLHFKQPWPVDICYKFPAKKVQSVVIGYKEELKDIPAILWTKEHCKQEDVFLVATRESISGRGMNITNNKEEDRSKRVPVSFIAAAIKLHYRVTDLHQYLYKKANPHKFIKDISYREVVKFMCSIDIFDLFKEKRLDLAEKLRTNIQDVLTRADIGVEVFYLGFESAHPPVAVGEAYESVIKALEEKHAAILDAQAYAKQTVHQAEAEAYSINKSAYVYNIQRTKISEADARRFGMRLSAYKISPSVFRIRNWLGAMEDSMTNIRKYVISSQAQTNLNTILNLEDKLSFGVEDIDLTATE